MACLKELGGGEVWCKLGGRWSEGRCFYKPQSKATSLSGETGALLHQVKGPGGMGQERLSLIRVEP